MAIKSALSLSSYLLLLITLLNIICMFTVSAYVLYEVNQTSKNNIQRQADIAVKTVQLQALRLTVGFENSQQFPDLSILDLAKKNQGSCISFVSAKQKRKSSCVANGVNKTWPNWFENIYLNLFHSINTIHTSIDYKGIHYGVLSVSQDLEIPLHHAWQKVNDIFLVSLALLLTLSTLLMMSMKPALKHVQHIINAIQQIANKQLSVQVKPSLIKELNTISNAINEMAEKLKETDQQNKQLTRKLVMIQEQERQHIAQELHDELAQSLAGLSATHSTLLRLANQQAPDMVSHITRASQINETMRQQCRHILAEIKPLDIDASLFESSLKQLTDLWDAQDESTQFEIDVQADLSLLPSEMLIHIYRIIQEGLTNIAKHANAKHANVKLEISAEHILLITIKDDGGLLELPTAQQTGLGLTGIKERVDALNGLYDFSINKPHGLIIKVFIPLQRLNNELS